MTSNSADSKTDYISFGLGILGASSGVLAALIFYPDVLTGALRYSNLKWIPVFTSVVSVAALAYRSVLNIRNNEIQLKHTRIINKQAEIMGMLVRRSENIERNDLSDIEYYGPGDGENATEPINENTFERELKRTSEDLLIGTLPYVKRLFWLDDQGSVHPDIKDERINESELALQQRILLIFIGKLYAKNAGIVRSAEMDPEDVAELLDVSKQSASTVMSTLQSKNYIEENSNNKYQLIDYQIYKILEDQFPFVMQTDSNSNI